MARRVATIVTFVSACVWVVQARAQQPGEAAAPSAFPMRDARTELGDERSPRELPFEDGYVPPGYHLESRPRKGLIIGGSVTLGSFYAFSLTAAMQSSSTEGRWLAVPVIGPWAAMSTHVDPCRDRHSSSDGFSCLDFAPMFEMIDALGQLTGAALLGAGFVSTRDVLVRDEGAAPSRSSAGAKLVLLPRATESARGFVVGMTAIGTF